MLLGHLLTFYFILLTFLHLSIDYCFISHIVKLHLSTFFQNKEHDDDDDDGTNHNQSNLPKMMLPIKC